MEAACAQLLAAGCSVVKNAASVGLYHFKTCEPAGPRAWESHPS
jgi:hypothetical protein